MTALIIAAGKMPSAELIIQRATESKLLIAADNGILGFEAAGIKPDMIVGDFDSAYNLDIDSYKKCGIDIIELEPAKNETDTEIAILIAKDRGAKNIYLLGAMGGRIDHTIANLMLLKFAYKLSVLLTIEDDYQCVQIGGGEFYITGKPGDTVSLFPLNESACVHAVDGLKYPLDQLVLTNANTRGISNVLTKDKAKVFSTDLLWIIKSK